MGKNTQKPRRSGSEDPWSDAQAEKWIAHVRHQVIPKIKESAMTMVIAPDSGEWDVKIAVELGASILLNKPIVITTQRGHPVSPALLRIADEVVEVDYDNMAASSGALAAAVQRINERGGFDDA